MSSSPLLVTKSCLKIQYLKKKRFYLASCNYLILGENTSIDENHESPSVDDDNNNTKKESDSSSDANDDDKSVDSFNTAASSLSLSENVCKICHCGEEVG